MVAKINRGASLYGAIIYNQQKVNEATGSIIAGNRMITDSLYDPDRIVRQTMFAFESYLAANRNTEKPILHISVSFFPILGLLCILRYTIQGAGYTNLAMLSGVSEMIARILVSLLAVPAFGYIAVCFGDPTAWIFADLFLIPAFIYVYRRILRMNKK